MAQKEAITDHVLPTPCKVYGACYRSGFGPRALPLQLEVDCEFKLCFKLQTLKVKLKVKSLVSSFANSSSSLRFQTELDLESVTWKL